MKNKVTTKNILITGGSGFIGSSFLSHIYGAEYNKNKKDFYSDKINYRIIAPGHKELDILNFDKLNNTFKNLLPEVVINFAAHRDANTAELQRGDINKSAWKTNVTGVENISKISQQYNSFFIHISTDMVFSGSRENPGPYSERTNPDTNVENLSWYGWTKAEAERILITNNNYAIVRVGNVTQALYNPKLDYIGKILYLYDHKKLYPLFIDQYLTLTYIPSMFIALENLIKSKEGGIFHIASKNVFTPYELGEYLIKKIRGQKGIIKGISINDYLKTLPNRYPKYGGLLAEESGKKLHVELYNWQQIVDFYIDKVNSS